MIKTQNVYTSIDYFFANSKKAYFGGVMEHYPQNEFFSQKSGSVSFLTLMQSNKVRSFKKFLYAVWKKRVYLLKH